MGHVLSRLKGNAGATTSVAQPSIRQEGDKKGKHMTQQQHRGMTAMRRIVVAGVLLLLPATAGAQLRAPLTRITTGDVVTIPAWYWAGSWGDYDDDGYLDLFAGATALSPRNYLYRNNHDGTFTLVDDTKMPRIPNNQQGAVWGDYDNDGHLDLFTTAGNYAPSPNALYHNNGDGSFSALTGDPLTSEVSIARGASWGDYDNDGFLDLVITANGSATELFHNTGDGSFTRVPAHDPAAGIVVSRHGVATSRTWVDYDNDGTLDLFVGHYGPQSGIAALYRNDGTGRFARVTDSGLTDAPESINAVCWADYDNDGALDLFVANSDVNSLYHNNGDGSFTAKPDSAVVMDTIPAEAIFSGCAWGDYDNDGFIDLLVTVGDGAAGTSGSEPRTHNFLYHNNGDGTFTRVTEGSAVTDLTTQCPDASWGDYDNDGFPDLVVSQGAFAGDAQTSFLYHNDGNGNGWLNVRLVGTVSNRSAIGAKVRVNAAYRGQSRWQLREIDGGDGEGNESNAVNPTFGLADAAQVDTVRVEWPSGAVQELHDVAPKQFLTLTEPYCAGDCDGAGAVTVDKLVTLVNIALDTAPRTACRRGVASSAAVDITLIVQAVNNTLNACPGTTLHLAKLGTEPAQSPAGQALAEPISVAVTDEEGRGVKGVSVRFMVDAGGGAVEPGLVVTGADGRASARWTLGIAPVDNRLRVSMNADTLTFSVRATLAAPLQTARFGNVNGFIDSHLGAQCEANVGGTECSTYGLAFDGKGHLVLGIPGGLLQMDPAGAVSAVSLSGDTIIDPQGMAFDQRGNLWVADLGGPIRFPLDEDRGLRKVSPAGVVSTALVEPLLSPTSIAVDAAGRVYVSDPCLGQVLRYDPDAATVDAVLSFDVGTQGGPLGVALEPGTGRIVVLTGPPASNCGGLDPIGLGSVYAAPVSDAGFGPITPLIDGFPGTSYPYRFGVGVSFDREGNLYAAFGEFTGDLLYNTLWVLPRGDIQPVRFLTAPGPGRPVFSNLAFGQGEFGASTLYLALTLRGQAPADARGADRFTVGIPGAAVPLAQ
jgi:hypothetical protein